MAYYYYYYYHHLCHIIIIIIIITTYGILLLSPMQAMDKNKTLTRKRINFDDQPRPPTHPPRGGKVRWGVRASGTIWGPLFNRVFSSQRFLSL